MMHQTTFRTFACLGAALSMSMLQASSSCTTNNYAHTIFVPRQLSYNPIFENALVLDKNEELSCGDWIFSVKPIYTQNVGSKFKRYFNIDHACSLNVREDGTGNVDSLWFQTISSDTTMYSSTLAFNPRRRTYGTMLYLGFELACSWELTINTAAVFATIANMNICETSIKTDGTVPDYLTMTEAFASPTLAYGKIDGERSKGGFDDIQIKFIRHMSAPECLRWDLYALLGVPTGKGSKALYLFEPLIGSKHLQLGLGSTGKWDITEGDCGAFSLLGEVKWRYGFGATETRSFDLQPNGQWSRYLLLDKQSALFEPYQAINSLTLPTKVTPRNSLDLYLAGHWKRDDWNVEVGYDFWFRQAEKVCLARCASFPLDLGVADLPGIAVEEPTSASTATISQSVPPNSNVMTSDATFTAIKVTNLNLTSGAQPRGMSNSIYASVSRLRPWKCSYETQIGLSAAYEIGTNVNTPNNVTVWMNFDLFM